MTIPVAGGTYRDSLITQVSGTRAELADAVKAELVAAGWTSVGSASDYQVTSATTPQGLSARVRAYDPGSGNCARLKWSNAAGGKTQAGDIFLLPAAAKQWRMISNRYQFFLYVQGASAAREFAGGGCPWVPSFVGITEAIWGQGNAESDAGATARISLRTSLSSVQGAASITPANQFLLTNGTVTEANAAGANSTYNGLLTVAGLFTSTWNTTGSGGLTYRWFDGSCFATEANVGWGSAAANAEAKIMGQLWDSVLMSADFSTDAIITYLGRSWRAVTQGNVGAAGVSARGTLFAAVN